MQAGGVVHQRPHQEGPRSHLERLVLYSLEVGTAGLADDRRPDWEAVLEYTAT